MLKFASFPSVEGFHNVVKLVENYPHLAPAPVTYRGKIKLHGTNAGVRVFHGEVAAQSRTQIITSKEDNAGFARWVEGNLDYWKALDNRVRPNDIPCDELTIFGEWCGPGVMKGTAINQIPNKIFAVFAIMVGGVGVAAEDGFPLEDHNPLVIEPDEIKRILGQTPKDVHVLPWANYEPFDVSYTERDTLQDVVDQLNAVIAKLEPSDPWVKEVFGVDGTAEGVVYYPTGNITRKKFSNFSFKAKGEKHKVARTKEAVQIDPEVLASMEAFVAMFVTEARLEQGLTAIGGKLEMSNVGPFLKWMCIDIVKESEDELECSDLEWKDVEKAVQTACRNWYIAKYKTI